MQGRQPKLGFTALPAFEIRTEVQEREKLLFDVMRHPFS